MLNPELRAEAARRLLDDRDLCEVLAEIEQAAAAVFLNASSTMEAISAAHEKVRAVKTLGSALQSRLTEQAIQAKRKDQHRGND